MNFRKFGERFMSRHRDLDPGKIIILPYANTEPSLESIKLNTLDASVPRKV
jgi:hypothetical protein